MSTRVGFLAVSVCIVLLPWLVWKIAAVRRVMPLAVVQILAGVVLGPSLFGRIAPGLHATLFTPPVLAALDGVANLGVLLYVFVTGLHLNVVTLRDEGRRLGWVAAGSIAVPFLFGLAAAGLMLGQVPGAIGAHGNPPEFMVAVAICIAVTALPVLAAVLQEMGILHGTIGQMGLAVAALNDAALWLMLALLLSWSGSRGGAVAFVSLATSVVWMSVVIAVIRPRLRRMHGLSDQAMLVIAVSLALVSAGLSEALGTGYLIGAFIAGVAIPSPWRPAILARIELLTAMVLLPFFFMSTGLKALIEPGSASFWTLLAIATAATIAGKLIGTMAPARAMGFSWPDSLSLGVMMQTKGLMEVVVLSVLNDAGLINRQIFSAMVAMAVICTITTAPGLRLCRSLSRRPAISPAA